MNKTVRQGLFATVFFAAGFAASYGASAKDLSRSDVEEIIKEYLMENPDIIMEASRKYAEKLREEQTKKASEAISGLKEDLQKDDYSGTLGPDDADVTIVEFFDYHCGYCKRMVPTINEVLEKDKKVKFVFKEFPILSEDSVLAAKAALAVRKLAPEKYFEYHTALMTRSGKYDVKYLVNRAGEMGIDKEKMVDAMDSDEVATALEKTRELAEKIGIRGTPAFIIGDEFVPGASNANSILQLVKEQRKKK